MNKLPDSTRDRATAPQAEPSGQIAVPQVVRTRADLDALAQEIRAADEVAVDVETDGINPIVAELVGIAIATAVDRAYYVPTKSENEPVADMSDVRDTVVEALAHHSNVVTHHGKFDLMVFLQAGFEGFTINYDTMLAAYLLQEPGLGLKDLAFRHLGWEMTNIQELIGTGRGQKTMDQVPIDEVTPYAGADVESTMRLQPILQEEIEARQQTDLLRNIEIPLVPVLIDMERAGIAIDSQMLDQLGADMAKQLDELETRIYELVGHEFNIGSTKQLGVVLFEELGMPTGRKTKTGYSVGQEVLEGLRGAHPVVDAILEHRTLKKLKSTYVDALPTQVNPKTGRVHTTYNQTIASTGRLSSTDPNLQNIPIRTAVGRQVRRAFVADNRPGYRLFEEKSILFSADYSQMELRIMAHFSQDPELVNAFTNGIDVHAATAAGVFGVPIEQVTSDMRATAKTVNFGIMYGMQAYGLSRDTGMSRQESTRFIEQYMARFSGVRKYLDQTLQDALRQGYVSSLYGRRRYVPDITAGGPRRMAAERAAINMPLQGTASDIMKIAMIQVQERLEKSGLRSKMLLQVHDELLFEAPESELADLRALVVETMEGVGDLSVPLRVEASRGPNWDDMVDFE
jgi:DNA polymerase-1